MGFTSGEHGLKHCWTEKWCTGEAAPNGAIERHPTLEACVEYKRLDAHKTVAVVDGNVLVRTVGTGIIHTYDQFIDKLVQTFRGYLAVADVLLITADEPAATPKCKENTTKKRDGDRDRLRECQGVSPAAVAQLAAGDPTDLHLAHFHSLRPLIDTRATRYRVMDEIFLRALEVARDEFQAAGLDGSAQGPARKAVVVDGLCVHGFTRPKGAPREPAVVGTDDTIACILAQRGCVGVAGRPEHDARWDDFEACWAAHARSYLPQSSHRPETRDSARMRYFVAPVTLGEGDIKAPELEQAIRYYSQAPPPDEGGLHLGKTAPLNAESFDAAAATATTIADVHGWNAWAQWLRQADAIVHVTPDSDQLAIAFLMQARLHCAAAERPRGATTNRVPPSAQLVKMSRRAAEEGQEYLDEDDAEEDAEEQEEQEEQEESQDSNAEGEDGLDANVTPLAYKRQRRLAPEVPVRSSAPLDSATTAIGSDQEPGAHVYRLRSFICIRETAKDAAEKLDICVGLQAWREADRKEVKNETVAAKTARTADAAIQAQRVLREWQRERQIHFGSKGRDAGYVVIDSTLCHNAIMRHILGNGWCTTHVSARATVARLLVATLNLSGNDYNVDAPGKGYADVLMDAFVMNMRRVAGCEGGLSALTRAVNTWRDPTNLQTPACASFLRDVTNEAGMTAIKMQGKTREQLRVVSDDRWLRAAWTSAYWEHRGSPSFLPLHASPAYYHQWGFVV